jgi:hypothetical protein
VENWRRLTFGREKAYGRDRREQLPAKASNMESISEDLLFCQEAVQSMSAFDMAFFYQLITVLFESYHTLWITTRFLWLDFSLMHYGRTTINQEREVRLMRENGLTPKRRWKFILARPNRVPG